MHTFKLVFVLLFLNLNFFGQNMQLSEQAEISIITVDPGHDLVDSFGHSAIRVKDNTQGIDLAYNYGTYNFNAPNFYTNFARGKLAYELSVTPFSPFFRYYAAQNRSIKEQILDLSFNDKKAFFDFLNNNAKPKNKGYLYDFFFDNCATKLPEVSQKVLHDSIKINYDYLKGKDLTFRELIHLNTEKQAWGKFGIDLALGSVIDRKAKPEEYMFLPDYVYLAYANAYYKQRPLVKTSVHLFKSQQIIEKKSSFGPFLLFLIIAILVIWLTYRDYKNKKRTKALDFLIFFFTGSVGLIVLLLWFATDHTATAYNFNFFWAFAPNLVLAFILFKKNRPTWLRKYIFFLLACLVLTVVLWALKVQIFTIALIPILVFLGVRYFYLLKTSV